MPIDATTQRLMARAKRAPRLCAADELKDIRAWQTRGDRAAAGRIIEANARHVVFTALTFKNYGIAISDLVSDGHLGLMRALDRFDESKGVRFSTYAIYWIRAEMVAGVLKGWSLLSGARGALNSRVFFRLRRQRALFSRLDQHGAQPDATRVLELLAADFGVSEQRMQVLLQQLDQRGVSLDATPHGQGPSLLEQLPGEADQGRELEGCQLRQQLERALEHGRAELDAREAFILEHRLLADPGEELSLAELGAHFGVSRERVRQLEVRTQRKLRRQALLQGVHADTDSADEPNPSSNEVCAA
jgi:RNA polymerase sigma-32 factor